MQVTEDSDFESIFICSTCFKNSEIREYIIRVGEVKKCNVCDTTTNKCINTKDKNLVRMFRSLIRYFYPEYTYNPHWGGSMSVSEILCLSNPILEIPKDVCNVVDKEIFSWIIDNMIGDSNVVHEIDLFAGCSDFGRDLFAKSLKDRGSQLWASISKQLSLINYTDLLDNIKDQFAELFSENEVVIPKLSNWFRARIGFEELKEISEEYQRELIRKVPYNSEGIGAPPPLLSTGGRANREGISYFYLASDLETAIAEVRPHPGHYVTVGEFRITEELKMLDLTNVNLYEYSKSCRKMEQFVLIKEICGEFEKPITPEIHNRYLKSQFISDIVRLSKYDGIFFNSSVASGKNIVVFNKSKVEGRLHNNVLRKILKHGYKIGKVSFEKDFFMDKYDEIIET